MNPEAQFEHWRTLTESCLTALLQPRASEFGGRESLSLTLFEAMGYSVLGGGKRTRALLVFSAARAVNENTSDTVLSRFAAALEMLHSYSLIHDDLPAMDNDELRRGKPSNHIAWGEASAILAGDALQALAFETIAETDCHAITKVQSLQTLAAAAGPRGMAGGQQLDLSAEQQEQTLEQLQDMHLLKTGALIRAAALMGAQAAGASHDQLQGLDSYARNLGLAFQIRDDILDIEASTAELGKPAGADQRLDKSTYPKLLGLDGSRRAAEALVAEALQQIEHLPGKTDCLRALADFVLTRQH